MKITDYMEQDLIFTDFNPVDKPGFLAMLADRVFERFPQINLEELLRKLTQREEAGSTGVGKGIAIPHATIEGLPKTVCMLFCVSDGIDFDAVDHLPVRVVFLLVSPPGETGLHIKLLARIARLVKGGEILNAVATNSTPDELYELIEREDNRHVE